ncbi:hypothetical protein IAU60_003065 [Kwoniella sp. DSM 27419]
MPEEPKKKRRQNVACDSCKLRRVKCDLADLLTALPSSSSNPDKPLAELVLENPDVQCKNCLSKGITCTTQGIINPTKPNKGGRRIDEAKKKFGLPELGGIGSHASVECDGSASADVTSSAQVYMSDPDDSTARQPAEGFPDCTVPPSFLTSLLPQDPHPPTLPPPSAYEPPSNIATQLIMDQFFENLFPGSSHAPLGPSTSEPLSLDADFVSAPAVTQFLSDDVATELFANLPSADMPSQDAPRPDGRGPNWDQALSIWRRFGNHPKTALNTYRRTGDTPAASPLDHLDPNSSRAFDTAPSLPSSAQCIQGILTGGTTDDDDPTNTANLTSFSPGLYGASLSDRSIHQQLKKRARSPSRDLTADERDGKVFLQSQDPWQLWSERPKEDRLVRWGRREVVEEKLADRALGMALSNHLVKTFFQAVHLSYPAISPESFYLEWARAGQRSDRMTPAQEALCAVIEAWGARYSDSPVILGLDPKKAATAPKVIQANGTFIPGTRARTHWGRARLSACKALMERARRLLDENGIFRKPSITGVQAMTLYSQMMHMTDQKVLDKDHWLQNRMVHSTIIEQMGILGLMWDSDGPIITDDSEATMSMSQLQLKQRRLFWIHVVGDAFFAAAIGELPRLSQADVDAAGEWIDAVTDRLPVSSFKLLAFFMSIYHRLGIAARAVAIEISHPLRKKGAANMDKILQAIRRVWREARGIERDLNERVADLLAACRKDELLGFSPLNFLSNLFLSAPFLLLVMHQIIREQLDFWKTVTTSSAYIVTPSDRSPSSSSPPHSSAGQQNVERLEALNKESVDELLRICRAQIGMLKAIIPTGIIQAASILLRVLMATAQLLAEVPTNEQGYPDTTPGGYGWTWETKQKEVDVCIEALHQVGWAWADVGDVLDSVMLTMERMTPSPEALSNWRRKQARDDSKVNQDMLRSMARQAEQNQRAMDTVLQFWPPTSIPHLIEMAMNKDPNSILEGDIEAMTNHLSANLPEANRRLTPAVVRDASAAYGTSTVSVSLDEGAQHDRQWPTPQPTFSPHEDRESVGSVNTGSDGANTLQWIDNATRAFEGGLSGLGHGDVAGWAETLRPDGDFNGAAHVSELGFPPVAVAEATPSVDASAALFPELARFDLRNPVQPGRSDDFGATSADPDPRLLEQGALLDQLLRLNNSRAYGAGGASQVMVDDPMRHLGATSDPHLSTGSEAAQTGQSLPGWPGATHAELEKLLKDIGSETSALLGKI